MPHERLIELQDGHESSDEIGRKHVAWDGPCEVSIVDSAAKFFEVDALSCVTPEMLAKAKADQPMKVFEVLGAGYTGESDETDDRVLWVKATSRAAVLAAVAGTRASFVDLVEVASDIDFVLPDQEGELRAKLLEFERLAPVPYVSASQFARSHKCDPEWVAAMGNSMVPVLCSGLVGKTSGYSATVLQHYVNGMYEVRVPGGVTCISWQDFEFEGKRPAEAESPRNVTIHGGLLTMPDGTTIDMMAIQAAMNFGYQETGDPTLRNACDQLSKITGMEQGPNGEFVRYEQSDRSVSRDVVRGG